jgi:hypothetical protein
MAAPRFSPLSLLDVVVVVCVCRLAPAFLCNEANSDLSARQVSSL